MLGNSKKIIWISVLMSSVLCFMSAFAAPCQSGSWKHTQPDGTVIELYKYGDEHYSFIGDSEGYLLEKGEDGGYTYATSGEGPALSSAEDGVRPANAVKGFDLKPDVSPFDTNTETAPEDDDEGIYYASNYTRGISFANSAKAALGNRKLLVVVVDYNDIQVNPSLLPNNEIYRKIFSTESGYGSVRNYYSDQSGGRFTYVPAFTSADVGKATGDGKHITDADTTDTYGVVADGVIKVKVNTNHPGNNGNSFLANAVAAVDPYVDFSAYDKSPVNKKVTPKELTVLFVLAGYNSSAVGNYTPAIGTHSSTGKQTVDGATIFYALEYKYACIGSMQTLTEGFTIGGVCHELGHTLYLPDFYNTNGSSKDFATMRYQSIMASGSWGRKSSDQLEGSWPCGFDPFSKLYLGWYDDDELLVINENDTGTYHLVSQYSSVKPNKSKNIYRFIKIQSSVDPTEYYVLENRDFNGYDAAIRFKGGVVEEGIALWRIDESRFNTSFPVYTDVNNTINCGLSLLNNGLVVTGSTTSAITTETFNGMYDKTKIFWSAGTNKFTFFGKQSYPNNNLSTVPSGSTATSNGIGIEFLSPPGAEVATIRVGAKDVNGFAYKNGNNTKLYMFNNTANKIRTTPVFAQFGDTTLTDVTKYDPITINANTYTTTADKTVTVDSTKTGRVLNMNFDTLKPYEIVQ